MNSQPDLSQHDSLFLLKLIMIAELDDEVYDHFAHHPSDYMLVERGDIVNLPEDLHRTTGSPLIVDPSPKRKEALDKVVSLIRRTPPKTSKLTTKVSDLFQLVGAFEGQLMDTSVVQELVDKEPLRAIDLLEQEFEWDFDTQVQALSGNFAQAASQVVNEPPYSDDLESEAHKLFKSRAEAMMYLFDKYDQKPLFGAAHDKLTVTFFDVLIGMGDRVVVFVGHDLRGKLLNSALKYATEGFWKQLLEVKELKEWDTFWEVINQLDIELFKRATNNKPLLERMTSFLDSDNHQEVIDIVRVKNWIEIPDLIALFINHFMVSTRDDVRTALLDLFGSADVNSEQSKTLISNLIQRKDYRLLNEILGISKFDMILCGEYSQNLREFLYNDLELEQDKAKNLMGSLWKVEAIQKYKLFDKDSFINFSKRMTLGSVDANRSHYVGLMTHSSIKRFLEGNEINRAAYIEGLETLYPACVTVDRIRIGRFINNLKKVAK